MTAVVAPSLPRDQMLDETIVLAGRLEEAVEQIIALTAECTLLKGRRAEAERAAVLASNRADSAATELLALERQQTALLDQLKLAERVADEHGRRAATSTAIAREVIAANALLVEHAAATRQRQVSLEMILDERDETIVEQAMRIVELEKELDELRSASEDAPQVSTEAERRAPIVPAPRQEAFLPDTDRATGLYSWQAEALAAWTAAGAHGVIEAVTGAGKTRVGIAAARMAADSGRKTLVLAPTIELIHQWRRNFAETAPELRVGLQGDGERDDLISNDVLISTIHSAVTHLQLPAHGGLLLADEVHTLGAPTFANALDVDADWRLGLTATYDRGDDGNDDYLDPYFGGVCYRLWYDRALADRVIAPFTVSLVGVRLDPAEQERYEEVDDKVRRAMHELVHHWGVPVAPFAEFMREVTRLSKNGDGRAMKVSRSFTKHFNRRREILAESHVKLHVLSELAPLAASAERTLVFTQTQETARQAADLLTTYGVEAMPMYSDMDRSSRKATMDAFQAGTTQLLAAPRLLDQGIDVPEADFGIIMSASRSRRQMVQRLGRVVRRKADGRCGRLVVLYAEGTVEDPGVGDESDSLSHILKYAERVQQFRVPEHLDELSEFLGDRYPCTAGSVRG